MGIHPNISDFSYLLSLLIFSVTVRGKDLALFLPCKWWSRDQVPESLKVTQLVRVYVCFEFWSFPQHCTDSPRADGWAMEAEERAINGPIVCVLSRTRTLGTHSLVCLLAVTQPASTPLNVKDTMSSKSLCIHIFRIITRINFDLFSYSENKNPWLSCFICLWFPQL